MDNQSQLSLSLSVEDVNKVLIGLMKLPYEQVVSLIGNIQVQAAQQLSTPVDNVGGKKQDVRNSVPTAVGVDEITPDVTH